MAKLLSKEIKLKSGQIIYLRSPTKKDAAAILTFLETIFIDGEGMTVSPGEYGVSVEDEQKLLDKMEKAENEIFILAESEGEIIGEVDFHVSARSRLAHGGWFGISIHPQWRGKGIGKILIQEMLDWARKTKTVEKINLNVIANNQRAISLYEKFGFKIDGRKTKAVKYKDGTYLDDLSMELLL